MLFHVSIEADRPQHVATVLAELMGGEAMPFPPVADGSWVAHAGDDRSTLVEVYPRGTELHPSEDGAIGIAAAPRRHNATHLALGTRLNAEDVFAICAREGWIASYYRRGGVFGIIEIFVERCQMIEVLTDDMQREYLGTMTIANWKAMLASGPGAAMPEIKQAA